jgi:hypothetical protein
MGENDFIKNVNYGSVNVVENKKYQWAVIDNDGNFIVPFGKYGWIDGFDSGLARVRTNKELGRAGFAESMIIDLTSDNPIVICGKENIQKFYDNDRIKHPEKYAKWGIINEKGEEVLPLIYDNIWNFLDKSRYSTRIEKAGETSDVYFCDLNPSLPDMRIRNSYSSYSSYGSHYGEYAGSYAQDVMGYSDEEIYDAFDGEPDAYWNID